MVTSGRQTFRIDRALSISPLDPILLATKGRILLAIADSTRSSGGIGNAVVFYRTLLAADPNNGLNGLRAGTAFALAGASLEAEEPFLTAAELAPESAVPLSNLARLYLAGGDLEGAVKAYQRASAIDPPRPTSTRLPSLCGPRRRYRRLGNLIGRPGVFKQMIAPGGTSWRWWMLGVMLALGIGAATVIWVLNRPDPLVPITSETEAEVVAAGFIDSNIAWSPEQTTIGGIASVSIVGSNGGFYALSTSPSLREMPQDGSPPAYSIYRSEDGATWAEQPIDGLGTELWLRSLAESGGNLYVVSTAPGVAGPDSSAISVGASDDGGSSWNSAALQLDARPPINLGQLMGKSVTPTLLPGLPSWWRPDLPGSSWTTTLWFLPES